LAAVAEPGISNTKLVPTAEKGCVKSAPNCFTSALISLEPSRLLTTIDQCLFAIGRTIQQDME